MLVGRVPILTLCERLAAVSEHLIGVPPTARHWPTTQCYASLPSDLALEFVALQNAALVYFEQYATGANPLGWVMNVWHLGAIPEKTEL
jgi:hypothetical protein